MKRKILIIDDEQAVLNFLNVLLMQAGTYHVDILQDSRQALDRLHKGAYDLLLLDMDMPHVTGLDILQGIEKQGIDLETIVLTGVEDVELAVSAMKAGAYDYLKKPVDNDLLLITMDRAIERKAMRQELAELKMDVRWESLENPSLFESIITRSQKMIKIFRWVENLAMTSTSVLIMGESGTGKELIARAIHKASARSEKPFIAVNAGVFAQELFASEFFGHIRGAFSGAYQDKKGFLEEAEAGTLFLDEIGELPMEAQVKMLRVLQDGEYFRVGSTKLMRSDVRLLAATNKNLWEEIEKGLFRRDLFFRLNVNTLSLPPLREREGDIALLSRHFLRRYCEQNNRKIGSLSREVLELLEHYSFPGNIRELQNIIQSAALFEQSEILRLSSLPSQFLEMVRKPVPSSQDDAERLLTLEELERNHIRKVLEASGANNTKAAQILGISRVTLIAKIRKYNLRSPD
jgi:DNA-binding NtrC family response regulator